VRFLVGVSCSVALGLSGCGELRRVSECKRFVALANQATAELRALDASNQVLPDPLTYDKLAMRYTRFAADIGSLEIRDPDLADAAADLRATMTGAARDCRDYARELREHEQTDRSQATAQLNVRRKLKKTRQRVGGNLRTYKAQVSAVNEACQPE
jgi:hypothetical protein